MSNNSCVQASWHLPWKSDATVSDTSSQGFWLSEVDLKTINRRVAQPGQQQYPYKVKVVGSKPTSPTIGSWPSGWRRWSPKPVGIRKKFLVCSNRTEPANVTEALLKLFIMIILCILCVFIYLASIFYLGFYYGEHNVTPSIWSVSCLFLPIINTIICVFLLNKTKDPNTSLKGFINELKNN